MKDNYEFCVTWVNLVRGPSEVRLLDYGCGAAQLVNMLRQNPRNDAYGCDMFESGNRFEQVPSCLTESGVVRRMKGNTIPFPSVSFDLVINNQVMEHVADLETALMEIHRVLKPGGIVLSLFPDKGVWREGHCGVPFLHWFRKGTSARIYYAAVWRLAGFGYHKADKTVMDWCNDFCHYLDEQTFYRRRDEIGSSYREYFFDLKHIEDCWVRMRLGSRLRFLAALLPSSLQKLIVTKLAGMVFTVRKAD